MTVRTAYPATESNGDTLTTTNFDKLPGGWIGYAEVTANQTSLSTSLADLTSLTVTVTVNTSRRIRITGKGRISNDTASKGVGVAIYESSTQLAEAVQHNVLANISTTCTAEVVLTPSAGSHTYKLRGETISGGTGTLVASSTNPAFILVEDIGPAS